MAEYANMILKSDCIYTVASETPLDGGIAVSGDKILAVGSMEELKALCDDDTKVLDYTGKMLMPGFIDAHTHVSPQSPVCDLHGATSVQECIDRMLAFEKENPDEKVLRGMGWSGKMIGEDLPTKEMLDPYFPDRPVLLFDMDGHQGWQNSAMLKLANLTEENVAQVEAEWPGTAELDENGKLTGLTHDGATLYVMQVIPEYPQEEYVAPCLDTWTQYGVTTVNDCSFFSSESEILKTLRDMELGERLNVRVMTSFDAMTATDEDIEKGKEMYQTDYLRVNALKSAIDGVAPGRTALMLRPYAGTTDVYGTKGYTKEELLDFLHMAVKHDLALHIHCCGDGSVRLALDTYEAAVKEGIKLDNRFSVEHCDTTAEEDVPRFAEYGVSANMTPDFLPGAPTFADSPYFVVLDEETQKGLWRGKSMYDSGCNLAFGTDINASSLNTMVQLYRAVERVADDGEPAGGYHPEEKLTIQEAIRCYTLHSARTVGMEDKIGTLEPGKYADIIAVDQNLLTCSPMELKNANVVMTMVGGRIAREV